MNTRPPAAAVLAPVAALPAHLSELPKPRRVKLALLVTAEELPPLVTVERFSDWLLTLSPPWVVPPVVGLEP